VRCIEVQANLYTSTTTNTKIRAKTSLGTVSDFTIGSVDGTYREYNYLIPINPDTKTFWTYSDLDSLKIGVEEVSTAQPVRCTRMACYVSFHEDPAVEAADFYSAVGTINSPTTTGFATVSGLGFKPKAILFIGANATSDGTNSDVILSYGVVTHKFNNQFVFLTFGDDGANPAVFASTSIDDYSMATTSVGSG